MFSWLPQKKSPHIDPLLTSAWVIPLLSQCCSSSLFLLFFFLIVCCIIAQADRGISQNSKLEKLHYSKIRSFMFSSEGPNIIICWLWGMLSDVFMDSGALSSYTFINQLKEQKLFIWVSNIRAVKKKNPLFLSSATWWQWHHLSAFHKRLNLDHKVSCHLFELQVSVQLNIAFLFWF